MVADENPSRSFVAGMYGVLFSSALVQVAGLVVTTLVGIQLARYLGPAQYGIYGIIFANVSILAVFAQFGIPLLSTREAAGAISARPQASLRSVTAWSLRVSILVSSAVTAVASAALLFWSPPWLEGRESLLGYGAAIVLVLAILAALCGLARGAGKNVAGQSADLLLKPAALSILLFVAAPSGELDLETALAVHVVATLIAIGYISILALKMYRSDPRPRLSYSPPSWTRTSMSFMSGYVMSALNGNYPILIAGLFVSAADVGVFRVALSSAALLGLPTAIVNIAMGPVIAKLHNAGDQRGIEQALSHSALLGFAATTIGIGVVAVAGKPLIVLLFGLDYGGAYGPLLLLGLSHLLVSAYGIVGTYLNMTGRENLVIQAMLISVPVGFAFSVPLTWSFGIQGAAFSNLVMVAIWHLFVVYLNGGKLGANFRLKELWHGPFRRTSDDAGSSA